VSTSTISVHCFRHPDITSTSTLLRITYSSVMPFRCRFAFKIGFFIFHGATESDGCGKTVSTFYDHVWIFSSVTRRSKFLFLHDETVWPRRDHRMVGQSALGNAISGTRVRLPAKKSHH
jgi:hypothetical protein